jgi:hypothetical protein
LNEPEELLSYSTAHQCELKTRVSRALYDESGGETYES